MSINFLHPVFQSTVTCSSPCVDGHEVTNLLSPHPAEQDRGFLPERFMKPPINIELSFPNQIELHRVVFTTVVGAQKSAGFELYSHSNNSKLVALSARNKQLRDQKQQQKTTTTTIKEKEPDISPDDKIFMKIGYGNVDHKSACCFTNFRFKERRPYMGLSAMWSRHSNNEGVASLSMYHHKDWQLSRVDSISLRLLRSAPGKLCAIKWLEVWGQPSYSCTPDVISVILQKHSSIVNPNPVIGLPSSSKQSNSNLSHQVSLRQSKYRHTITEQNCDESVESVTIPEDFLDPVTLELMSMPMLVPSGQTVDQYTLDKHNTEEAKWGRPPNNPFTGVAFSQNSKPVPNTALKTRIDRFLLQKSDSLPLVARTLGSSSGSSKNSAKISSLLYPHTFRDERVNLPPSHSISQCSSTAMSFAKEVQDSRSSKPPETIHSSKSAHVESMKRKVDWDYDSDRKKSANSSGTTNIAEQVTRSRTKPEPTASSIDDAIANTLQTLPSFLRPTTPEQQTRSIVKCSSCHNTTGSSFYQLQCKHVVCRQCLMGQSTGEAPVLDTHSPGGAVVDKMTTCVVCGAVILHQFINRLHLLWWSSLLFARCIY